MENSLDIGNKIKEIRENERLNQREFAENIGLFSADHLRKIERGDVKEPKYEHLIAISKYSGISIEYILKGPTDIMPRLPQNMNMSLHTPMAKQALEELNKINGCSNVIAQSIKSLDCVAVVGMEYLEKQRKKFDKDPEVEKMIKLVKMEGRIAN